jgi:sugar lactone lactonase YvrE
LSGLVRIVERSAHDLLGEGCMWSAREQAIFWVDILAKRVHRLHLPTGSIETWSMPDHVGWLIERERGGFVAGLGRAFVALTLDPLAFEILASPEPEQIGNRCNDAKADPFGRIWTGTMPMSCDRPAGAFYRLDPDGQATRVDAPYTIPNGPAISADGGTMYHADSALRTVFRYRIREDGSIAERSVHIVFEGGEGQPDGMTMDREGGLWIACWEGSCVARYDSDGRREREIVLPASQITSCTFAGEALDRMFVTSSADGVSEEHGGALFEIDPGCRGLPTLRYAG